jgi:hypothetical protein
MKGVLNHSITALKTERLKLPDLIFKQNMAGASNRVLG